jgi:hypothetical protein
MSEVTIVLLPTPSEGMQHATYKLDCNDKEKEIERRNKPSPTSKMRTSLRMLLTRKWKEKKRGRVVEAGKDSDSDYGARLALRQRREDGDIGPLHLCKLLKRRRKE